MGAQGPDGMEARLGNSWAGLCGKTPKVTLKRWARTKL